MSTTSKKCDSDEHAACNGSCVYIDQDGASIYRCECHCHAKANHERRIAEARREAHRKIIEALRPLPQEDQAEVLAKFTKRGGDA